MHVLRASRERCDCGQKKTSEGVALVTMHARRIPCKLISGVSKTKLKIVALYATRLRKQRDENQIWPSAERCKHETLAKRFFRRIVVIEDNTTK
jgi:hypothetical protein